MTDERNEADQALLRRCIEGDEIAWRRLYRREHSYLLLTGLQLSGNETLTTEAVDNLWCELASRPSLLLGYKPARAGLRTYLVACLRRHIRSLRRSEARRYRRECAVARCEGRSSGDAAPLPDGFLESLTAAEKKFLSTVLLGGDRSQYSADNVWQLTHRVREKLLELLY